jgi:alpha-L-fucosidase
MLGVAPDERGLLPDADVKRLHELGEAIHSRYADNLLHSHLPTDSNTTNALDGDDATFWSAPAGSNSSTLEVHLPRPITFDQAMTMEWLNQGQAVQRYRIEAWQAGKWVPVVNGYAIGHKKIDHFPPVTTQRVRLCILSSVGTAHIREFQLFHQASAVP